MKLVDILPVENIKIPLAGETKKEIITELVDVLVYSNPLIDQKTVLEAVLERENTMSTGIGDGVAIPHAKTEGVKEIAASLGIKKEGADFDSTDGEPVTLFFLLASPVGPAGPHLRCLSRISRLLNKSSFRERLLAAESPEEAFGVIDDEEKQYFDMD